MNTKADFKYFFKFYYLACIIEKVKEFKATTLDDKA